MDPCIQDPGMKFPAWRHSAVRMPQTSVAVTGRIIPRTGPWATFGGEFLPRAVRFPRTRAPGLRVVEKIDVLGVAEPTVPALACDLWQHSLLYELPHQVVRGEIADLHQILHVVDRDDRVLVEMLQHSMPAARSERVCPPP